MDSSQIEDVVKDILVTDIFVEVPVEQMRPDDSLRDDYGLDSLGFVELRSQAEERFGIRITADEFTPANFGSIAEVVALVARLRESTPGSLARG